ncbi:MAG: 16S rRNA (cytidine(1402)-2'-O)-methyltransferase [Gammaproteobacteria bacterium]|nr:16S rRNA (cytidine(1402)-2'-O)-methyltransferase [Gammaproteobacteria bacterium]
MKHGVLYIVATPIGNRSDMGQRAIEILSEVKLIAAEDTRHSRHLLQHFNIDTHMWAYHDHNEQQQTPVLIERMLSGDDIALISDAGTPLLSDPGYRLVKAAHEAGIKVSPVPGPCAAIAALSASGLATDQFCFAGFPPNKSSARIAFFEALTKSRATQVFYESSHRVAASLADMVTVFGGEREAVLAREISKTFETIHKATVAELSQWVQEDENQRKGEFVLVVQGNTQQQASTTVELEQMLAILMDELPLKQASGLAAKITGRKKNQVYKLALDLQAK